MLEQALISLLKNAEQALSATQASVVELTAMIDKRGNPVIEISDNGHGMTSDVAHNVFVPFSRLSEMAQASAWH